ncbi:MAG: serine/threonine protein kinase [Deltaproteobacteria bacterium]|nr:serine/threonine protein kinase [Deltaproteobacteria bacterium]
MTDPSCSVCGSSHPPGALCSPPPDERVGTILEGKYEIVRVIGVGGMGKVYEGRHARIGRRVAIKFLLPQFASHPEIVRRFENEARAAGSLEHENIAVVYDVGQTDDGARYLVMEFLKGEDCDHLLTRDGPLPVVRALNIVLQVCRGLDAAHRADIVHRDLKPANLFLTKRADRTDLAKILDFGIAKLRTHAGEPGTATGLAMGTPHYMSPEQARGDKSIDHRTDIYALGVILYELLSGQKPHAGDSYLEVVYSILTREVTPIESLRQGMPAGLPDVIRRAMSLEPSARYQTVADLGDALIPFAGGSIPAFRSQGAATPPGNPLGETLATPSDPTSETPKTSTAPPVSPRTRVSSSDTGGKTRWVIGIAAVAILGAAAFGVRHRLVSRSSPTATDVQGLVASAPSVSAGASSESSAAHAPTAPLSSATGQSDERPDTGAQTASASAPRKDAKDAGADGRKADEPPRPAESASSAAPTPPAPPRPASPGGAVDINRDPSF